MSKSESTNSYYLALDQGTTSSRAILFDQAGLEVSRGSAELAVSFPNDAWVEQAPDDIWLTQQRAMFEALEFFNKSDVSLGQLKAIGISNQRETTIAWCKESGKALSQAIVWQCRRSAPFCEQLRLEGHEELIRKKTGLQIDPYFSATKISWLLENDAELSKRVSRGEVLFGTVDSWILSNLCEPASDGTRIAVTEPSNACRTLLYSLDDSDWDDELLSLFSLTRENVCSIQPSFSHFGDVLIEGHRVPICGVLGDQQASLLGHSCTEKDSVK